MATVRNTLRCCISCILPCGSLDVVRVVHSDGTVAEFGRTISAGEVMKANPKHVIRKSSLLATEEGHLVSRVVVLPPEAELQKGKIYFLTPVSPPSKEAAAGRRRKKRVSDGSKGSSIEVTKLLVTDQYLSEIMSENLSVHRDIRRGRVGVWRPHLESISEVSP